MKAVASALVATLVIGAPGCATTSSSLGPQPLTSLQVGAVSEPSTFERRESATRNTQTYDKPEPANASKRRKTAFWVGVGLASFGAVGAVATGIGGRIVQGQLARGYDDQDLTRADEDRLTNTGKAMNGIAIGSASIGLIGVVLLSAAYALDHARCGDLPPKRASCPGNAPPTSDDPPAEAPPPDEAPAVDAAPVADTAATDVPEAPDTPPPSDAPPTSEAASE